VDVQCGSKYIWGNYSKYKCDQVTFQVWLF
jgi:hypothetical protein